MNEQIHNKLINTLSIICIFSCSLHWFTWYSMHLYWCGIYTASQN